MQYSTLLQFRRRDLRSVSAFIFLVFFSLRFSAKSVIHSAGSGRIRLPQGNPLYAIHFDKDKETGYAVGADGAVLATTDGGFNWKSQLLPVDTTLSGVFVKDKKHAVIVGARGNDLYDGQTAAKIGRRVNSTCQRPFLQHNFHRRGLYNIGLDGRNLRTNH